MTKEISIENHTLQEEILDFCGWKLYTLNQFPDKARLEDLIIKKQVNDELIVKFLSNFYEDDDNFQKKINGDEIRKINKEEVAFQLGEGTYKIPIAEGIVEVQFVYSKEIYTVSNDLSPYKTLFLRGEENHISQLISEMDNYRKKTDKINFKVYSPNPRGYWEQLFRNPKRLVETVFINRKQEIIDDIDEFISSESDYKTFGNPYKRNYLFYGPPGNGKTSFIHAIASKYNLDVFLVSFSSIVTDEFFKKLISLIPKNALLVMEDIDVLFDEREKKNCSMSSVLNIMDGLARKTRIICIMTTNNYERLSEAFKRPGRVDMTVEFNKADGDCFRQMAEFMCTYHNEMDVEMVREKAISFYNSVSHMEPSRALVQKFLFENRKRSSSEIFSKKMVGKFKELHNIYYNQLSEDNKKKETILYS